MDRDNKGHFIKGHKKVGNYKTPKERPAWNKGKKIQTNTGKTHFKKGFTPWNKGKKGLQVSWNKGKKLPEQSERQRGENNPNWKDNRMAEYSENDKIRKSLEGKLWIKSCLVRDNFTCQKTGQRGGRLQVHHINNFSDFPELRLSLKNGITLSVESHKLFHKIYGRQNNTMEQLKEFLNN